jgi:tRNA(adenine34) deaminase
MLTPFGLLAGLTLAGMLYDSLADYAPERQTAGSTAILLFWSSFVTLSRTKESSVHDWRLRFIRNENQHAATSISRECSVIQASAQSLCLSAVPLPVHEQAMQFAIAAARANPFFPFGAVIVRAADREVMATGVNNGSANPTFHGEIVAMNDYVARNGNQGWGEVILYTTAEPCPMCMGALAWARIGGVVYGTSIEKLRQIGIDQILLSSTTVIGAAPFFFGEILGEILVSETDALFVNRKRL